MSGKKNLRLGCIQRSTAYILPVLNLQPSIVPRHHQQSHGLRRFYLHLCFPQDCHQPAWISFRNITIWTTAYRRRARSLLFPWLSNYSLEITLHFKKKKLAQCTFSGSSPSKVHHIQEAFCSSPNPPFS